MFYFYVLKSNTDELYFGSTNDLKRRLKEHNTGKSFATKGSLWKLIYYEAYASEIDARAREQRIKNYGQAWNQLKKRMKNSRRLESWCGVDPVTNFGSVSSTIRFLQFCFLYYKL